jgi:hypothetical protein
MLMNLALSSAIDAVDLNEFDPRTRSDSGIYVGQVIDEDFVPQLVAYSGGEDDLPLLKQATTEIDHILSRLRSFRTWRQNWDAEGAEPPDPNLLERAIVLLSLLAPTRVRFGVGLDADSRPMFNIRDSIYDGHIVLENDGTLSFFFQRDNQELSGHNIPFDGRSLPVELEQSLELV